MCFTRRRSRSNAYTHYILARIWYLYSHSVGRPTSAEMSKSIMSSTSRCRRMEKACKPWKSRKSTTAAVPDTCRAYLQTYGIYGTSYRTSTRKNTCEYGVSSQKSPLIEHIDAKSVGFGPEDSQFLRVFTEPWRRTSAASSRHRSITLTTGSQATFERVGFNSN